MHPFFCSAGLVLVAVTASLGQAAPGGATQIPDAAPASAVSTATPGAPDMVPNMQFPNSDVQDVLHFYETLTGKRLVMDNFVQGKVNIFISKPISREEAIRIIEMNLSLNGFSLVPAEGDIIEVVGTGKSPRAASVPVISDESEIPSGDQVVSYLFKLRYADAIELQQALTQYLTGAGTNPSPILALPKSASLLVTQSCGIIRRLVKIVDQIDVPPAEVVSEFIKLERADASKVVDLLKDIFEKGDRTGAGPQYPGAARGIRPPVPQPVPVENEAGGLAALTEDSVVVGKIKLTADVRTNRIHVVTRPINMPFIRKLIAEFDANVEFAKPVTRPLRYISAGDVMPVLIQALTEPGEQAPGAEGGAAPGASPGQQRRTATATGTTGGLAGNTSTSTTGGTGSTLNISEELETQPVDTTPKAVTVGNAKIIADQRANAIIVLGNREVVVKVQKILDEMDVKAPQVALSTVIGELTLTNDEEFGVDYFLRLNKKVAGTTNFTGIPPLAGGGTTTTTTPSPGATGTPTTTTTGGNIFNPGQGVLSFSQFAQSAAKGGNVYLAAGTTLAAVVHLLESTNRFRVISRPMVFTSNNKKAIIASGQEVPVPVSTLTNAATTVTGVASVASSVDFKKVALQLEVVPLINSEKEVSLDILQKIDSLVPNGNVNIGGNQVPTIATRYIRTNVTAPNGGTIILGGLIQDMKGRSYSGLPYLSRIPLVGALFRGTTKNRDRTELVVLMCPEVTLTKLDLYRLRVKNEEKTHFGPELDQDNCADCPPSGSEKQLPPPDLPTVRDVDKGK